MTRKKKNTAARYSGNIVAPRKGWKSEQIGTLVKVSGLFMQSRTLSPVPHLVLLPEVTACVVTERECIFPALDNNIKYMPAAWHPRAMPKKLEHAKKYLLADLSNDIEIETTITKLILVPKNANV